MHKSALLLLFLFLTITYSGDVGMAFAAEIRRDVIVFDFLSLNSETIGEEFSASLRDSLKNTGKYMVLDTSMVKKALTNQQYFPGQALDQDTALKVGKVMGADQVVLGSVILDPGGTYTVKVLFLNVKTGRPVYGKKITSENRGGFLDLSTAIALSLTKPPDYAKVQSLPQENTPPKEHSSSKSNWALGLLYPGASLKYYEKNHSFELKAQAGSGIVAAGPRYCRYITSSALRLFWGMEADFISFKGAESRGTGIAGGIFAGGEIPISENLSLSTDFGPMYLTLSETDYSQSVSNIEYVLNMAIYWHF
jgi:hypothetical protein